MPKSNELPNDKSRAIGARIRGRRLDLKLNTDACAVKIGISSSHLSVIERGESIPLDKTLRRVARFFRCTVEDLTSGPVPVIPPAPNVRRLPAKRKRRAAA